MWKSTGMGLCFLWSVSPWMHICNLVPRYGNISLGVRFGRRARVEKFFPWTLRPGSYWDILWMINSHVHRGLLSPALAIVFRLPWCGPAGLLLTHQCVFGEQLYWLHFCCCSQEVKGLFPPVFIICCLDVFLTLDLGAVSTRATFHCWYRFSEDPFLHLRAVSAQALAASTQASRSVPCITCCAHPRVWNSR